MIASAGAANPQQLAATQKDNGKAGVSWDELVGGVRTVYSKEKLGYPARVWQGEVDGLKQTRVYLYDVPSVVDVGGLAGVYASALGIDEAEAVTVFDAGAWHGVVDAAVDDEDGKLVEDERATQERPETDQTTIEMLVVYTPSAVAWKGQSQVSAEVEAAVEHANEVLRDSKTGVAVTLVAAPIPIAFREPHEEPVRGTVRALQYDQIAEVRSLKQQYNPDYVLVVVGVSLRGHALGGAQGLFGVVTTQDLQDTLVHELGHAFGCDHPAEEDQYLKFQPYSKGYQFADGEAAKATVMQASHWTREVVPLFSNPHVKYDGRIPVGVAGEADCSRMIREMAPMLAQASDNTDGLTIDSNDVFTFHTVAGLPPIGDRKIVITNRGDQPREIVFAFRWMDSDPGIAITADFPSLLLSKSVGAGDSMHGAIRVRSVPRSVKPGIYRGILSFYEPGQAGWYQPWLVREFAVEVAEDPFSSLTLAGELPASKEMIGQIDAMVERLSGMVQNYEGDKQTLLQEYHASPISLGWLDRLVSDYENILEDATYVYEVELPTYRAELIANNEPALNHKLLLMLDKLDKADIPNWVQALEALHVDMEEQLAKAGTPVVTEELEPCATKPDIITTVLGASQVLDVVHDEQVFQVNLLRLDCTGWVDVRGERFIVPQQKTVLLKEMGPSTPVLFSVDASKFGANPWREYDTVIVEDSLGNRDSDSLSFRVHPRAQDRPGVTQLFGSFDSRYHTGAKDWRVSGREWDYVQIDVTNPEDWSLKVTVSEPGLLHHAVSADLSRFESVSFRIRSLTSAGVGAQVALSVREIDGDGWVAPISHTITSDYRWVSVKLADFKYTDAWGPPSGDGLRKLQWIEEIGFEFSGNVSGEFAIDDIELLQTNSEQQDTP